MTTLNLLSAPFRGDIQKPPYCERGQGAIVATNGERGDWLCVEILHSLARVYEWLDYYHYLDNQ